MVHFLLSLYAEGLQPQKLLYFVPLYKERGSMYYRIVYVIVTSVDTISKGFLSKDLG